MEQLALRLMGRLDGPSTAPTALVSQAKTYRQAVRLAWISRRIHYATQRQLAAEAGLYAPHVSDYLNTDDKPTRRSLPAEAIAHYETFVGNTIVSQWLAAQAKLTVLEEMQATRAAA
jgi:hypothetical protein